MTHMMKDRATRRTSHRRLALTGSGVLALALLTGCTTAEPEAEDTPAGDGAAPATTAPAEASPTAGDQGTGTPTGTATPGGDDQSPTGTAAAGGDDPVFAAIDALYAEHPGVFIVQVDRDDDTAYEIEAHEAGAIREFNVTAEGSVREDDDPDDDDDHVRRARDATVTAEEAAEAALEGRDGQTVDEMELDEEDGTLVWKVELDHQDGEDGDELHVDAATGEVTEDR